MRITLQLPYPVPAKGLRLRGKDAAAAYLGSGKVTLYPCVVVQVLVFTPSQRDLNLLKFAKEFDRAWDGLCDAGLILCRSALLHLPVRQRYDKGKPRVTVILATGRLVGRGEPLRLRFVEDAPASR